MPIRGQPLPLRPRPLRKSPASPMPTGRRAAAGTDPPRKTGTARNATSFSAGTPPIWHNVERADPEGTPPAMPVFVPARFEERRQGCRRGNLKGYSTRGDSPSLLRHLRTIVLLSAAAAAAGLGRAQTVTFNEHIAPIVYGNCTKCHRPGQVAPFSLLSYDDVRTHGRTIATVTQSPTCRPGNPSRGGPRIAMSAASRPHRSLSSSSGWTAACRRATRGTRRWFRNTPMPGNSARPTSFWKCPPPFPCPPTAPISTAISSYPPTSPPTNGSAPSN